MTVARYELRSAAELDALARAPLPLGIRGGAPQHSAHRDVYLDTPDDALRARGIVCRLRIGERAPHRLSLRIPGASAEAIDANVRSAEPAEAVAQDTAVRRRLQALVEPAALVARTELEVERMTRHAQRDLLGRPRVEQGLPGLQDTANVIVDIEGENSALASCSDAQYGFSSLGHGFTPCLRSGLVRFCIQSVNHVVHRSDR